MRTLKRFATLDIIKELFNIKTGLFIIESQGDVTVCNSDDDAVIVKIGWVCGDEYEIDTELASHADDIYNSLKAYLEGGCHDGLSMIVLSLIEHDGSYTVYGDDTDGDCEPIQIDTNSVVGMIEELNKLI